MRRRDLEHAVIEAAREVAAFPDTDEGMVEVKWDEMIKLRDAIDNLDKLREIEKPRANRVAPITSHQAAAWVGENTQTSMLGKVFYRIYWLSRHGQPTAAGGGATTDELVARLGPHESVSGRVTELANAGWIVDSGVKRRTRKGRDAIVWVPSPAARQAVNDGATH